MHSTEAHGLRYSVGELNAGFVVRGGENIERDEGDIGLVFFYGGSWTLFPLEHAVPFETARKAMKLFFECQGALPSDLHWTTNVLWPDATE